MTIREYLAYKVRMHPFLSSFTVGWTLGYLLTIMFGLIGMVVGMVLSAVLCARLTLWANKRKVGWIPLPKR